MLRAEEGGGEPAGDRPGQEPGLWGIVLAAGEGRRLQPFLAALTSSGRRSRGPLLVPREQPVTVVREDRRHARLLLEAGRQRQGESPQPAGEFPRAHGARPGSPCLRLREDREAKLALAARYRELGHEAEVAGDREAASLFRGLAAEETRHAQVLLDLPAATDPYHN